MMDDLTQIRTLIENISFNVFLIIAVYILYRDSRLARLDEKEKTERTLNALTNQIFTLTEKIATLIDLLARSGNPTFPEPSRSAIPKPNGVKSPD